MKIDFKTLNMMQLRRSPGEVLDRVARDGEVFVIERNGEPRGCLVPVAFLLPDIPPARIGEELGKLAERNENYKLTINDKKELEIHCRENLAGDDLLVTIVLPHGYPASAPRIYVEQLAPNTPHRWQDGSLSIFGITGLWNPKSHDVVHALSLARAWLKDYVKWRRTGNWPGKVDADEKGPDLRED